jgi:hypothetical protein
VILETHLESDQSGSSRTARGVEDVEDGRVRALEDEVAVVNAS